ncbi:hypothetical protein Q8F55_007246 [Vanrija albida]|uniref:HD domain-containing protein n=1 Tax=Vanrija albida TaxID=181172 RepID=A0ABR3PZD9_9TREE
MSAATPQSEREAHGWPAAPRDLAVLVKGTAKGKAFSASDFVVPDTPLAKAVEQYAKDNLPSQTFSHSHRVYLYSKAILAQHFPDWKLTDETLFLTCMMHDIGTSHHAHRDTLMSFEFYGGFLALNLIQSHGGAKSQAESVCECVIRHQDLGTTGTQTQLGAVIQLATVFDNAGLNPDLVATSTIESVVKAWPRDGWSACFAENVAEEIELKPWCHSTHIDNFSGLIMANKLMEPYDAKL